MASIGLDEMVFWDSCEKKRVLVAWKGSSKSNQEDDLLVFLEQLIFISDALHGCSTTVWAGSMKDPTQKSWWWVIIKDSWINPLQKFMEENLLARLNNANVKGVPQLIHKQQVQAPHPSGTGVTVNMSMHFLHAFLLLSYSHPYQLQVLSCLVTEPCGASIMSFSSLTELLIAFINYVSSMSLLIHASQSILLMIFLKSTKMWSTRWKSFTITKSASHSMEFFRWWQSVPRLSQLPTTGYPCVPTNQDEEYHVSWPSWRLGLHYSTRCPLLHPAINTSHLSS